MTCCETLDGLMDRGLVENAPPHRLSSGTIITDIDTEYFLAFGREDRRQFAGINYCPFCGRALSRQLWNQEKKK
ncbi:MAG TPA: hypothetical protein VN736_00655 [Candidatus Limnocylindrales bacterium]|jgi:hypothetical protein|nr:hypothetical protein [Candidatus Limnocylindrales bacterium]